MKKIALLPILIMLFSCSEKQQDTKVIASDTSPKQTQTEFVDDIKLGNKRYFVDFTNKEQIQNHEIWKKEAQDLVNILEQKEKEMPSIIDAWVQLSTGTEDGRFSDKKLGQFKIEKQIVNELKIAAEKVFGTGLYPNPAGLSHCTVAIYSFENWIDFARQDLHDQKLGKIINEPLGVKYKKQYKEDLQICKQQIKNAPELKFIVLAHKGDEIPDNCTVMDDSLTIYPTSSNKVVSLDCTTDVIKYIEKLDSEGKNNYSM